MSDFMEDEQPRGKKPLVSDKAASWIYRFFLISILGFFVTQQLEDFKKIREIDVLSRDYRELKKIVSDNQGDIISRMKEMQTQFNSMSQSVALTDQMLRSSLLERMRLAEEKISLNAAMDLETQRELTRMREELAILKERARANSEKLRDGKPPGKS